MWHLNKFLLLHILIAYRKQRQKRQARRLHHRRPTAFVQPDQNMVAISAPFCQEEGIVLIQGDNNYFMKCQKNPVTGGFFQIIYVCPLEMHSVDDTTKCIPPPDCQQCNGGMGEADVYGSNGLV